VLTFEQIKELATLVAEKGLDAIEIERTGFRLLVQGRSSSGQASEASQTTHSTPPSLTEAVPQPAVATAIAAAPLPPSAHILNSPIVGTFYRSPSPDSDPYVQVGDRVRRGQVLCIIEAMKLMNEIESDVDGEVVEIVPKNAQAVEFGEPLFAIRAS
jgi:acetyl-CoA carboxylase biotin carboxyl carrier protein